MMVRSITAGTTNQVASPARQRNFLAILNQSESATLYVAFDQPAVATATAGQLTIGPLNPGIGQAESGSAVFRGIGETPWQTINIIASGAGTPVTILE